MPQQIQILPESLINKIAAGEVVERPFSVVKELFENALDAGAEQITVTVKNGGKTLIAVSDDGVGMSAADARLSVQRHATSKIDTLESLETINTMGFRGEALAAIASVSRLELFTCRDEQESGFHLQVEGSKLVSAGAIGFPKGTKVVVQDLFYNTPARQKFMRAEKTEFKHIHDFLLRIALCRPDVHIKLIHNTSLIFNLPATNSWRQRTAQCYGSTIADSLLTFEHEESYLKAEALLCKPEMSKPTRRWQQIYVNNRYISSPFISKAVYEGYNTLLMKQQHPVFLLKIVLPPSEIDVNVHPAKTEVRFRNQDLVHTILASQIAAFLRQERRSAFFPSSPNQEASHQEPSSAKSGGAGDSSPPDPRSDEQGKKQEVLRNQGATGVKSYAEVLTEQIPKSSIAVHDLRQESEQEAPPESEAAYTEPLSSFRPPSPKRFEHSTQLDLPVDTRPPEARLRVAQQSPVARNLTQPPVQAPQEGAGWRVIGQYRKYILAQKSKNLVYIDIHAAHERVRFEEIRQRFFQKTMDTLILLTPTLITLHPADRLVLEQHEEFWQNLGFIIDHLGKNDYAIKQIPSIFRDLDLAVLVQETCAEMGRFGKSSGINRYYDRIFETMACHSSVRGEAHLTQPEMEALIAQLSSLDIHLFCPHGRPVIIESGMEELDKRFKRS